MMQKRSKTAGTPAWLAQLKTKGGAILPFEIPGIHTPLLHLKRKNRRIKGSFIGHAELMSSQGEPRQYAGLSDAQKEAVLRLEHKRVLLDSVPWEGRTARDNWAYRCNFLFYLYLVEPDHAVGLRYGDAPRDNALGLLCERSLCLVTREHVEVYGELEAYQRLMQHYRKWSALGKPDISAYPVEWASGKATKKRSRANVLGWIQRPKECLCVYYPKKQAAHSGRKRA